MTKPIIMALDTSKSAGFAIWNTANDPSSIKAGVLQFKDGESIEYCAGQMGLKIVSMIREHKPNFIIMEESIKTTMKGASATIVSNMLHGAVIATCENMRVLWGTIPIATWRKMFFGSGFKPPQKPVMKKGVQEIDQYGKPKFVNDWKAAAVASCEKAGITLPTQKTIAHNAAEAAAMAYCWRGAEIHNDRDRTRFMELLQRRNDRSAA